MKKILAVFIVGILVCGIALAQDAPAGNQAGAKSLNFTFSGLGAFGLTGTGPAGGLGISYFLSSDAAVRLGLQVGINSATIPFNPPGNNPTQTGSDGDFSEMVIGVGADYLMYMSGGRVKPYMGVGVGVTLTSNSGKDAVATGGVAGEITNGMRSDYIALNSPVIPSNDPALVLGLTGIVGAEFYIYNQISLSAEYSVNLFSMLSYSDTEMTAGANTQTTKNGSGISILGIGAGGATIHIYL